MTLQNDFQPASPEEGALVRVRMTIAYNGAPFLGYADQGPGTKTVARALKEAMSRLLRYEPELTVAGRTDAGVHAWGQIVAFDVSQRLLDRYSLERMQKSINRQLGPAIAVREIAFAAPKFDARRSPSARRYRYTIYNAQIANPFLSTTTWHVPVALDLEAMNKAAEAIVGTHDFSSFCKKPAFSKEIAPGTQAALDALGLERGHLVRRIHSAEWLRLPDDVVRFDIEAKSFCHQMVRALVGTLVDIGVGKRPLDEMAELLATKDRKTASRPAPPQGLCLWEVVEEDDGREDVAPDD